MSVEGLEHGQSANCPRCGGFLTRYRADAYDHVLSYSIAGLTLLVLANAYSFLSFSASGMESVMTLAQTPGALWDYGMPGMAFVVAAFIIVIPAIVLVLLVALCVPLRQGRGAPWLVSVAKMVFLCQNWAMVEVFIIGVIVSLVKIAKMATVELGISFWAYTAFSIAFTLAITGLDRYRCWQDIERVSTEATMQEAKT